MERSARDPVTTIGIVNAGEVGSKLARAAITSGYTVVIANSRRPEMLTRLVDRLGPSARAASAPDAAATGDVVVVAAPLKRINDMPVGELAGRVVIDTNNYMAWHDDHYPLVDEGKMTEHELRQEQLSASKVVRRTRPGQPAAAATPSRS
jgi:predicted dinucleotide-binding enzyme